MVALRSPRGRPAEPAAAPAVEPAAPVITPPSDTPMADNLERAAAEIPFPPQGSGPDVSALSAQIEAQKNAQLVQQRAFEQQQQIAAAIRAEQGPKQEQPKQELSEQDYQFLGSHKGIERDPTFGPSVQAAAFLHGYGTPSFYASLELKYPRKNYDAPRLSEAAERAEAEPKPRRIVTSGPVSRSGTASGAYVPSANSIKLTAAEAEIARNAGLTPVEYAKQRLKMEALKKAGHYKEDEG